MSLLFKRVWREIRNFWLTVDMILTKAEYFATQTRLLRMLANKFNNPNEIAEHTIINDSSPITNRGTSDFKPIYEVSMIKKQVIVENLLCAIFKKKAKHVTNFGKKRAINFLKQGKRARTFE